MHHRPEANSSAADIAPAIHRVSLARAPRAVQPSVWAFPDPRDADEDGVVGVGADLGPSTLVAAYSRGIFPWPHHDMPLPWFSPDPRGVITPAEVHIARSLRRRIRTCGWETSVDVAFDAVVEACAAVRREEGTWISTDMAQAYRELHRLGWAHSVEVWDGSTLVGGLYGVQIGAVFTGESMFHARTDASKVALVALAQRFHAAGGQLIDVQITTAHLMRLGAHDMPRDAFLDLLMALRDAPVRLRTDRESTVMLLEDPGTHLQVTQ